MPQAKGSELGFICHERMSEGDERNEDGEAQECQPTSVSVVHRRDAAAVG